MIVSAYILILFFSFLSLTLASDVDDIISHYRALELAVTSGSGSPALANMRPRTGSRTGTLSGRSPNPSPSEGLGHMSGGDSALLQAAVILGYKRGLEEGMASGPTETLESGLGLGLGTGSHLTEATFPRLIKFHYENYIWLVRSPLVDSNAAPHPNPPSSSSTSPSFRSNPSLLSLKRAFVARLKEASIVELRERVGLEGFTESVTLYYKDHEGVFFRMNGQEDVDNATLDWHQAKQAMHFMVKIAPK